MDAVNAFNMEVQFARVIAQSIELKTKANANKCWAKRQPWLICQITNLIETLINLSN